MFPIFPALALISAMPEAVSNVERFAMTSNRPFKQKCQNGHRDEHETNLPQWDIIDTLLSRAIDQTLRWYR